MPQFSFQAWKERGQKSISTAFSCKAGGTAYGPKRTPWAARRTPLFT
jgi:hypothetical protein